MPREMPEGLDEFSIEVWTQDGSDPEPVWDHLADEFGYERAEIFDFELDEAELDVDEETGDRLCSYRVWRWST